MFWFTIALQVEFERRRLLLLAIQITHVGQCYVFTCRNEPSYSIGRMFKFRDITQRAIIGALIDLSTDLGTNTTVVVQCEEVEDYPCETFEVQNCNLDEDELDQFGFAVAVDGDYAVVEAPGVDIYVEEDGWYDDYGAAYVFVRSGGDWSLETVLQPASIDANWQFGHSVDIDGDRIVVGAPGAPGEGGVESGAVWVFKRSGGGKDVWDDGFTDMEAKLYSDDSGSTDDGSFGDSVAIDGERIVVGASGTINGSSVTHGAGYVFYADMDSDSTFDYYDADQEARLEATGTLGELDNCGHSVDISGDRIAVGCSGRDPGGTTDAGSVLVFYIAATGYGGDDSNNFEDGDDDLEAEMYASDKAPYDNLGWSVSMTNDFIVTGAPEVGSSNGAAYIFNRAKAGGGTVFEGGSTDQETKLTNAYGGNLFGWSVGITVADVDGVNLERVIVGSRNDATTGTGNGAAFTFQRTTPAWGVGGAYRSKLTSPDPNPAYDYYGWAVALDGDTAIIGAPSGSYANPIVPGEAYIRCVAYGK